MVLQNPTISYYIKNIKEIKVNEDEIMVLKEVKD